DALEPGALDDMVAAARKNQVPIYMIRIAATFKLGGIPQDPMWKKACEQKGGRFYAAADEDDLFRAIGEVSALTPGRIEVRTYQQPRFAGFALIAVVLWLGAGALKLGFRQFRVFP